MMKYDLHDSLIEKVQYFVDKKRVEIIIELCNWKQNGYKDTEPEMISICITFDEVERYESSIEDYVFCSNEILDVVKVDDQTIKIVFFADSDAEIIIVKAKKVFHTIISD